MRRSKDRSIFIALCVAPATILFFIFMVLPTFNVFRMSLFERGAYSPTETFVGLNNFKVLFQDAKFISAMQNTILLIVIVTIVTFFFALLFAGILTREKITRKKFCPLIFSRVRIPGEDQGTELFPGDLLHPQHSLRGGYRRYLLRHLQAGKRDAQLHPVLYLRP